MADSSNPAFPFTERSGDGSHYHSHPGMSLRDWFAGQALTGLLASGQWHNTGAGFAEHISMQAAEIADAMLLARGEG